MVLEGFAPSEADPGIHDRHRITWTPSKDGHEVRQLWEVYSAETQDWTVAFDGRYRRTG